MMTPEKEAVERRWLYVRGGMRSSRCRLFELHGDSIVWRSAPGSAVRGEIPLDDISEVSLVHSEAEGKFTCVLGTASRTLHLDSNVASDARAWATAVVGATRGRGGRKLEQRETLTRYRRAAMVPQQRVRWLSRQSPEPRTTTMMYAKILARVGELKVAKEAAKKRASEDAAAVAQQCMDATLDASALRSMFSKEDELFSESGAREVAELVDERLQAVRATAGPRLAYATQLHATAARATRNALLAGWARCGLARSDVRKGVDVEAWHRRWADTGVLATQPELSTAWLHLDATTLRVYHNPPPDHPELEGLPLADLDAGPVDARVGSSSFFGRAAETSSYLRHGLLGVVAEAEGDDLAREEGRRAWRATLGRRTLRLERVVARGDEASLRAERETLALVGAEAALRDDCDDADRSAPRVLVVDDTLVVSRKSETVLSARFFGSRTLDFEARDAADAEAWHGALLSAARAARKLEISATLDLSGASSRPSRAPTAPKYSIDVLAGDAIATFALASEDERSRWLVALERAALDADDPDRPRARGLFAEAREDDDDDDDDKTAKAAAAAASQERLKAAKRKLGGITRRRERRLAARSVSLPPVREPDDDDDPLDGVVRRAATCGPGEIDAVARKLQVIEAEALQRAAAARDAAVELRRRSSADREKTYLLRTRSGSLRVAPGKGPAQTVLCRQGRDTRGDAREAKAIEYVLARGAVVVVKVDPGTTDAMRFEYSTIDPDECRSVSSPSKKASSNARLASETQDHPTLLDEYKTWREAYSLQTPEARWRAAVKERIAKQADRWRASLAAIDVMLPTQSAVLLLRLLDGPDEFSRPAKDGDVAIIWSPMAAKGGYDISFADRARASAPVVAALLAWADKHRVLAQRFIRTDASSTDQDEGAPLDYARVMRLLFHHTLL